MDRPHNVLSFQKTHSREMGHPMTTAARLRIFRPDNDKETLATAFWERLAHKWDARTTAEYASTAKLWAQTTGDPPLDAITDETVGFFAEKLADRQGRRGNLSPNTIRKHLRQLRAILNELGPKRNGRGLGLIQQIPYCPLPKPRRQPPVAWTPQQIAQLANAADFFQADTAPIPPAQFWKTLIRLIYNTAMRIGTALALQWDWIDDTGWIAIPAEAMKGKAVGRRFYLNSATRRDLDALPRDDPHIFPWKHSTMTLQRCRRHVQKCAGLPEDDRHGFHAIRRASLSAIATLNPLIARIVAGHSQGDVLLEYYISPDVIAATLEQLKQPF